MAGMMAGKAGIVTGAAAGSFGALDFARDNAGAEYHGPLADTPETEWDRVMAVNLKGGWLGPKARLPRNGGAGQRCGR